MKLKGLTCIVFAASLGLTGCATNSDDAELAQAKQNFAQQKYDVAFQQLQQPAEQGDPEAEYALGYMYYYGKGTPINQKLGKEWIKKAADAGDSSAEQAYQMIIQQEQQNLTAPQDENNAESQNTTVNNPAPVAHPVTAAVPATHTANASHTISGSGYTLQLANAPSAAAAAAYVKQHHLGSKAKYYSRELNGQTVYTVIYGQYSSRKAALTAVQHLPTNIRKAKPWPRSLSSVKAEMQHSDN